MPIKEDSGKLIIIEKKSDLACIDTTSHALLLELSSSKPCSNCNDVDLLTVFERKVARARKTNSAAANDTTATISIVTLKSVNRLNISFALFASLLLGMKGRVGDRDEDAEVGRSVGIPVVGESTVGDMETNADVGANEALPVTETVPLQTLLSLHPSCRLYV